MSDHLSFLGGTTEAFRRLCDLSKAAQSPTNPLVDTVSLRLSPKLYSQSAARSDMRGFLLD
ncbi:MAG: hypothetical protein IBX69_13390 [Anaerolineales bacterium]|nr:hypothetical protein [Anaerolineales bacterium]